MLGALAAWLQTVIARRLEPLLRAFEQERQRLFDVLALLGLGLMLLAISVCCALAMLWWSLSESARWAVMMWAVSLLGLLGLALLLWARARWNAAR